MKTIFELKVGSSKQLVVSLVATIAILASLGFKLLDPKADAQHPLLKRLASLLDTYGVDVIQDWNSAVTTRSSTVLAPLANWTSLQNTDRFNAGWVDELESGYLGSIQAIETTEMIGESVFLQQWLAAPEHRRIFISFTAADMPIASKIKSVLEKQGYAVFIFLNELGELRFPAERVGECMRSAGEHFVVDTKSSRGSYGVLREAQLLAKYHPRLPVVALYGRESCGITRYYKRYFERYGVPVKYYDIDQNAMANAYVNRNLKFLRNENTLPLFTVNGTPVKCTEPNIQTLVENAIRIRRDYPNSFNRRLGIQNTRGPGQASSLQAPSCR